MHLRAMVDALREAGNEVVITGPRGTDSDEFGSESRLVSWLRARVPRAVYELMELGYSVIGGARLLAATLKHKPDVIYERYNLFAPAGIWVKRLLRLPLIAEVNAPLYHERSRYGGIALKRLARWSERYVWRNADICLPVTGVLAAFVREAGVPEERIKVIPNGVDLEELRPTRPAAEIRRRLFAGADPFVLGFVGFVRDWHGLDKVIDLLRDAELAAYEPALLIVGDGPARAALEAQAKVLGLESRVVFTGVVGREEIKDYIGAFDVALQPNVVSYASPLKLFEYLALGRAIVAPRTPNIEEVLAHEHNALLFAPDDVGELKRCLVRLAGDPELRRKLQAAAFATIVEGGYTWRKNAARVEDMALQLARAS